MPSADAFLQAILANPDDDTPRLVYADWLEERGDPRGEFIRLQCELQQLPYSNPRVSQLRDREEELRQQHAQSWLGPLFEFIHFYRFKRGFLEEVTVEAVNFLEHGEDFFRLAPIRHVLFYNAGPLIPALCGVPHLGKAMSVDFRYNQLGDAGVRSLVCSPHLTRVLALGLVGNDIGDEGARALAESPWLSALETLKLAENRITDAGVLLLARSRYLMRLRHVDLRWTRVIGEATGELTARFKEVLLS